MKRFITFLLLFATVLFAGCSKEKTYVLNENTFFLVMTNIQYYPEQYEDATIEYDCFTYELTDVDGNEYVCGVRKCSSGFGCTCGKDTIIGFLLQCDEKLPKAKNQSEDNADKTWVHLKGKLTDTQKRSITVYSYLSDGTVDKENTEQIIFLEYQVESYRLIEDYSNLKYYVTK